MVAANPKHAKIRGTRIEHKLFFSQTFRGGLYWKSFRKRGKFKTKFLAARQFINPTQAP